MTFTYGKSSISCPKKTKWFCSLKIFRNAPLKSLNRWGIIILVYLPLCAVILCTLSTVTSIRWAVWIMWSMMVSVTVGSPIASYQLSVGSWEVMMMDFRPCGSSIISSRRGHQGSQGRSHPRWVVRSVRFSWV